MTSSRDVQETVNQAPGAAEPRPGPLFMVLFVLAFMGIMSATATPVAVTLALRAQQLFGDGKGVVLATTLAVGTIFAAIANPLGGYLSDRTTSRFGMRRPWMVIGILGGLVGITIVATASTAWALVVGWSIAQFFFNLAFAALYAVLSDKIPAGNRGRISGFIGVTLQLGITSGSWVAVWFSGNAVLMFLVPAALATVTVFALVAVLPDRRLDRSEIVARTGVPLRERLAGIRQYRDFGFVWLGRFLLMVGYFMFVSFQLYTLTDHMGLAVAAATAIVALNSTLSVGIKIVVSPLSGWISDRLGRRRILVGGSSVLFAAAMVVIGSATDVVTFVAGACLSYIAYGMFLAVDLALASDVLPQDGSAGGFGLGLYNVAGTASQSLSPVIAVAVLAITGGSYPMLYATAAALMLLGACAVLPIRSVR